MRAPESVAVEVQRTLSLACVSTGIPDPNVTFFHNSIEVEFDVRVRQVGHFLIIANADDTDSGEYYCRAENIVGNVLSASARLVVFSKSTS